MTAVSFRHHLAGLGSAIVFFGALALVGKQFSTPQGRGLEVARNQDSASDVFDVTVVNSNLIDFSRLAATRALSKSTEIGFIYTSDSLCAGVADTTGLLKGMKVYSVKEFEAPTYLIRGAAELGERQSISSACLDARPKSRLVYSGSRELKRELLTNGVAPRYITVSGLK